jgi:hypothetical protein
MRSHWMAVFIGPALVVASCARNPANRELATTIVRFVQDSVPLQRTADMTKFTVSVIIRNDGHGPVVFGGCGPEAQRNIGGEWQTVWTPICGSPQHASIAPGDSLILPITVAGFTVAGLEPPLDPRMLPGTYRLRFGIAYPDTSNPTSSNELEALNSPSFTVYQP